MAKMFQRQQLKNNVLTEDTKRLQDMAYASNYGISRDFILKHEDIVNKSSKAIMDVLVGYGVTDVTNTTNSLQYLNSVVARSIRFKTQNEFGDLLNPAVTDPVTGIKEITPLGNIDFTEQQIIDDFSKLYSGFFAITNEYKGVVDLIPKIGKAIENICRDILSVSELTGRIFNKIYDTQDDLPLSKDEKMRIANITDIIQEQIIDKNHLEDKMKAWVQESVICGVKPIAFIPYDYIIRQMKTLNKYDKNLNIDVDRFSQKVSSHESAPICSTESQRNTFYRDCIEERLEDIVKDKSSESAITESTESILDGILDDVIVDQYASDCESLFENGYKNVQPRKTRVMQDNELYASRHNGKFSIESENELKLLETMEKNYSEIHEKYTNLSQDERRKEARAGLKKLARYIDERIDVVKPGASSAFIAQKVMNQKDRYSQFYNLGENYLMAEGLKRKKENKKLRSGGNGVIGDPDADSSELGKDCLIIPYSPQSVIPININGEYMGFYCIEYENVMGPQWRKRQKAGSFTDFLKQYGFGDDASFVRGSSPLVAFGGQDPLENNLYSPMNMYNFSLNQFLFGGSEDNEHRYDIMKTITLRVLSHRLHDPDLADNKIFKDAVMTMLRNDYLCHKKVQFTFIPPEYMVYMTYQVDEDGIPKSILDGTLLWCYLYLSSIISSAMIKLMKASDKEKYEVEVGLIKNAGYTIDELQRVLSTRTLYSSGMFGSLASVVKNAGNYQRLIIPVVNGEKVYDVSPVEHMNDISVDDQYTNDLLSNILSKIYINSGMMSEMEGVDFASQFAWKNADYRDSIVTAQHNYEHHITKALRLLVNYSPLETYNSKVEALNHDKANETRKETAIDLSKVEVELNIPTMLNMHGIQELVDASKQTAQTLSEAMGIDGSASSQHEMAKAKLFQKKIIQKYANNVEWSDLEKLMAEAEAEAPAEVARQNRFAKLDELAMNQQGGEDPNGAAGGDMSGMDGMNMGGSTDDIGGGDMGGDVSF